MILSTPVLLTIVFFILKVTGIIAWSWLWILSPLWIAAVVSLVVMLVFVVAATVWK